MAPLNLTRKRKYADFATPPPPPMFKDFDDIAMDDVFTNAKFSICVRVIVKFPANRYGDDMHFILMDKPGAKIEAIVAGNEQVNRFKDILESGKNYTIHNVTSCLNAEDIIFRNIGHTFECAFDRKTNVINCTMGIPFPLYPKEFTPYQEVHACPNKTFVDIVAIVIYYGDLEIVGRYPYAEQYREVIFMDLRLSRYIRAHHHCMEPRSHCSCCTSA
ncbi:hypothetical protein BRADI_1g74109v3 [Brachypodium distachyon]|uniref:Replication protein A 70 kDa DNA-binding subunit B/D first OB fold domain-containing protein n=1 Tax=Brachypodium distachyon TaxID=15368 RepID=A0A2K2DV19_BRADI|nr:hypothetical protein BRADI_1g74109v3 [Brachypodium distachyon]